MKAKKITYNIFENNWWWGHSTTFVASDGKSIIDLSITNDDPENGYLRSLMVHDSVRCQGRATELIDFAEKEALCRGCKYIYINANKTQWVKGWYERLGYKTYCENEDSEGRTVTMKKELV